MATHHIKMFVVDGAIYYIQHNPSDPSNDEPGAHVRAPTKDVVRFRARDDGAFSIEFKVESPFDSGNGRPGYPIVSNDGSLTSPETLKKIPTITRSYPYTVTLGGLTDDPEIIIDNSGGGGGKPKKKKKK